MTNSDRFAPGLEGVIAAQTRLSHVDGEQGELLIAGYPVETLAHYASPEEVIYLLWHDELPTTGQLTTFREELAAARLLPDPTLALLAAAAEARMQPMEALRMASATLDLTNEPTSDRLAIAIVAQIPTVVAAYARLLQGKEPITPSTHLSRAANYLYMLDGEAPSSSRARALATYLITVSDHGLNASTFAARTITSTGSDLVSAVCGAVGALKGPRHGGAPGPALETILAIGHPRRAERFLRDKLERGERLMGFGHRVYKVRDPRADILAAAADRLYESGEARGGSTLFELAGHVEKTAIELLEEYKPGRSLQTNVEFYTALLLYGLGLDAEYFSPTFAVARVAGWLGHCFEQIGSGRLIRPHSIFTGERREWPRPDRRN